MRTMKCATALFLTVAAAMPAWGSTQWLISDADRSRAISVANQQAAQKAFAERSCYLPAEPRTCKWKAGLWTCRAELPTKPSNCGKRGKWNRAVAQ